MFHRVLLVCTLLAAAACGRDPRGPSEEGSPAPVDYGEGCYACLDLATPFDLRSGSLPNACGDNERNGKTVSVGQPFPLHTDPMKDPRAADDGVGRDANGYLGLDQAHASFDFLWIANSEDWGRGTVSKLSSKSIRE